ncbi:Uncharacterised protein [Neisseria gonorrhoeae]|uniref:Uncharacterized protein n=1 Tax=Neisseria gonorrhoeae TaxID=485 RepID=A0A378W1L9_NEIGO|nr:Uncharacterised protein [Neisseria gonorrhoeae]
MLKRADSACLPAKKIGIDVDAARSAGIHYGGTTRSIIKQAPEKGGIPKSGTEIAARIGGIPQPAGETVGSSRNVGYFRPPFSGC